MDENLPRNEPSEVWVMEDQDLPEMCALCAAAASKKKRVTASYRDSADPQNQGSHWSRFLGLAGLIMARQERKDSLTKETRVIYLPV